MVGHQVVWKYPLSGFTGEQNVQLPKGCKILFVGAQNGIIHLWVLVTHKPVDEWEDHVFEVFATGEEISGWNRREHIGTTMVGPEVWHVFRHTK